MMRRRDAVIGTILAATGLAALAAKPGAGPIQRRRIDLSGLIARQVAGWQAIEAQDVILADVEELGGGEYDQLAIGQYRGPQHEGVTAVLAHGMAQSYGTQLHRPEICYPASGFRILEQQNLALDLNGRRVPAGALVAQRAGRVETVLYWTRIGDSFPLGVWAQRLTVATAAITSRGQDGLLARFSTNGSDVAARDRLVQFAASFVEAQDDAARRLLIGTTAV